MSEKRILCIEVSGACQYLMNIDRPAIAALCECPQGLYCNKKIAWKPITKHTCKNCKEGKYQGITREQTIERVAKGICSCDCDYLCGDCSCYDDPEACKRFIENAGYDKLAEVALEALLEGNNASSNWGNQVDEPEPLKLEVGKFYKTRDGRKAFVYGKYTGTDVLYPYAIVVVNEPDSEICVMEDGKVVPRKEKQIDLVAPWEE